MKVEQIKSSSRNSWEFIRDNNLGNLANLVFAFANSELISESWVYDDLKTKYPNADIICCGTCGEIMNHEILNDCVVVTALYLEKTTFQTVEINIEDVKDSFDAGTHLSAELDKDFITNLLIIADNQKINGSDLLTGIHINLSDHIPVLGGMSGEGTQDKKSLIGLNGYPKEGMVLGIGFQGENLKISHGLDYAWSAIGAEKEVTKVTNKRVYEIDHKSAFHFYKQYLDGLVDDIYSDGIFYPLGITNKMGEKRLIRSVLNFHEDGSMTFAGNFNVGDRIRMMKSNTQRLIASAGEAAELSTSRLDQKEADFVLVFNCVGRRNVLKDWSIDELECVNSKFSNQPPFMGFFSHGEFSPCKVGTKSELHNQSLVIVAFREI